MNAFTKSMTMLDEHDDEREDDDDALHGGIVAVLEVDEELVADARPVERRLGEDRAAEQERELEADDGDDGDERVLERVPVDDRALVDAARPRRLDVVLLQRPDDVDPDEPDEDTADR